ncbi:MAG: RluA family pseudouridine synthase [Eubacteriales bacterium]
MILYEDNHLLVAVKPQNTPSQADESGDPDFLNKLKQYVKEKYNKPGEAYLGLVHRLDRPTGGVMVFARTSKAAARLSAQLKTGVMQKVYAAIVSADIPAAADLSDYLKKNEQTNTTTVVAEGTPSAKLAILHYDISRKAGGYSLLSVQLHTGRSHQIRVQLANIGAPLVGDVRYGGQPCEKLCLWAQKLSFVHPTTKEPLTFTAPYPLYAPWNLFK